MCQSISRRIDSLVTSSWDLTRQAGEKRQRGIDLRVRQRAVGSLETRTGSSPIDGVEECGIACRRNSRKIPPLLVVTGEEEQPALEKRAAGCAAKLIARVDRFQRDHMRRAIDGDGLKSSRIARAPRVVAIVDEGGAVKRVRSALRDGIDHAAGAAAIFRRVIRDVDVNFTNRGETDPVGDACASALVRQKGLIVVAAIDRIAVEQAADASKTDRAQRTIRGGRGRQECEVGPAAAVVGKIVECRLIEVNGELLPCGVDAGHAGWRKAGVRRV